MKGSENALYLTRARSVLIRNLPPILKTECVYDQTSYQDSRCHCVFGAWHRQLRPGKTNDSVGAMGSGELSAGAGKGLPKGDWRTGRGRNHAMARFSDQGLP